MNKSLSEIDIINESCSTLGECSFDSTNNEKMIDSGKKVFNFDKVKETMLNRIYVDLKQGSGTNMLHSLDALYELEGKNGKSEYVFVEFKNGAGTKIKYNVQKKVYDSVIMLSELLNENVSSFRKNCFFVLVYNKEKVSNNDGVLVGGTISSSRDKISSIISKKAGGHFVKFGLEMFRGYLFKDVYTFDKEEYQSKIDNEMIG
jgi:hypothetical protein